MQIPTVTLNNGVEMPVLGFGVYQVPPDETERVVVDALAVGYRSIDTAAAYENEAAVGRALASSGIPRDELFITTKVWIQRGGAETVRREFESSLERLGIDRLDLYLVHQPYGDYYSAWHAMEQFYADGLVRAIGVSNFFPDRLVDLNLHNDVTPAVNQVETNPFHQRVDEQRLMAELGVQIESWAPFAEGRNNLFTDPTLTAIGHRHMKTVAQVVVRWLMQRGVVVVSKSVRLDRMAENLGVLDFELTEDDMATIAGLDSGSSVFFDHRDPAMVEWLGRLRVD